jgi:hypothetical protein
MSGAVPLLPPCPMVCTGIRVPFARFYLLAEWLSAVPIGELRACVLAVRPSVLLHVCDVT